MIFITYSYSICLHIFHIVTRFLRKILTFTEKKWNLKQMKIKDSNLTLTSPELMVTIRTSFVQILNFIRDVDIS